MLNGKEMQNFIREDVIYLTDQLQKLENVINLPYETWSENEFFLIEDVTEALSESLMPTLLNLGGLVMAAMLNQKEM